MTDNKDSRYVFSVIRERMRAHQGDVIDFAFGRDRIALPENLERVIESEPRSVLRRASADETAEMIKAATRWLARSFAVELQAESILPVPGSRAAMSALSATLLEPGDRVLVTQPGYPAFERLARGAHAEVIAADQDPRRGFEPAVDVLESKTCRLLALNYPNNPTGSVATAESLTAFLPHCDERTVWFNDAAYAALTFDRTSFSLLAAAAEIGAPPLLELHSLAKVLPLGSMSTAFLAGDPELVGRIRELSDFAWSPLSSLQARLARICLEQDQALVAVRDDIRERLDRLARSLDRIGFPVFIPRGGLYMLTRCPSAIEGKSVRSAREAAERLLDDHGLAVVPFDVPPDRYLRFSALYRPEDLESLEGLKIAVQP